MSLNLPFGVRVANSDPLDADRYIATDLAARDALISAGRAHTGLQVYVTSEDTLFILRSGNIWAPIAMGGANIAQNGLIIENEAIKMVANLVRTLLS